ncbi:hypothetical protein PTKIN_Ptkin06aG0168000 [Pterospermum kingtungense]
MGGAAWTEEEDDLLKKCIERYGEGKWHRVPHLAGLNRCRKSCRLRWLNYLRPNIKRGTFAEEEVLLIIKLHKLLGNRWSLIARRLPGRTANDVKNYWNCHLRKRLSAEETAEEDQNAIDVKIMRPQPRHTATVPCSMKPRTPDGSTAASSQLPTIEDGGHEPVKPEVEDSSQGVEEPGIFVSDLATDFGQFDEVNVLTSTTDKGCSKWDWDDLLLDMDLWTNSL